MEKRYVMADTGKAVLLGDTVVFDYEKSYSFGHVKTHIEETLTPENVEKFVKAGVIKEVPKLNRAKARPKVSTDIITYIKILAKHLNMSLEDACSLLDSMNAVSPVSVLNLLLSEIANELYKNGIKTADPDWHVISTLTGEAISFKEPSIEMVHNVTVFASKEDAELARTILREQLANMYGENC